MDFLDELNETERAQAKQEVSDFAMHLIQSVMRHSAEHANIPRLAWLVAITEAFHAWKDFASREIQYNREEPLP
jgi:hypothetical protein